MELAAMDLNLLLVLDALLREKSVSKAAKTLHLTQPAVSNALGRLRHILDDPLFVRSPHGMVPTPRAETMVMPLQQALSMLDQALFSGQSFDPKKARRDFRISIDDYAAYVGTARLAALVAAEAPGVRLEFVSPKERLPLTELSRGTIDLAVRVAQADHAGFYRKPILKENFLCLARRRHPMIKKKLSLACFVQLPHVLVSPFGGTTGLVDEKLASLSLARRVVLVVHQFTHAPLALRDSDWLCTLPARLARQFAEIYDLDCWELPFAMDPFESFLLWHERTHHDAACQWLRQCFYAAMR